MTAITYITTEVRPGKLQALDDVSRGLGEGQPDEHVAGPDRDQYQRVHHSPAGRDRVEEQAHSAEVGLQLPPRLWVGQQDRVLGPAGTAALGAIAPKGALGDSDAPTREQVADLDHGQALVDQFLYLVVVRLKDSPGLAMAARASGADLFDHGCYQLIAQLGLTTVPGYAESFSRLHIAPHRLAVDASGVGYPAQPLCAPQPPP
ncbi:MAG TPA: hypothetical protein VMF65_13245 [Acidimicrobiales bacterium]|nr:hypothetical protein [Acidimicrobiales bacterium]